MQLFPILNSQLLSRGKEGKQRRPGQIVTPASLVGKREKSDLILVERENYTSLFPVSPFLRRGLEGGAARNLSSNGRQGSSLGEYERSRYPNPAR